jgi:hypothetical protein
MYGEPTGRCDWSGRNEARDAEDDDSHDVRLHGWVKKRARSAEA